MSHAHFILSTCGTALLTNQVGGPQERQRINRYSNTKTPDQMPDEDREWLENLRDQMRGELLKASLPTVARMSAELNGLIKFYSKALAGCLRTGCGTSMKGWTIWRATLKQTGIKNRCVFTT